MNYDIWIIHKRREILLTDAPGVPVDVVTKSDGTLGGTLFNRDDWRHTSDRTEAEAIARRESLYFNYPIRRQFLQEP